MVKTFEYILCGKFLSICFIALHHYSVTEHGTINILIHRQSRSGTRLNRGHVLVSVNSWCCGRDCSNIAAMTAVLVLCRHLLEVRQPARIPMSRVRMQKALRQAATAVRVRESEDATGSTGSRVVNSVEVKSRGRKG